ncbi:hypothetical protein RIF29_08352 [Crotalaria pallida]|uniref:RING-type domain-containing protein n=1 Tax=Crotalaria pallida TaxID=3830 RepID=A0AAN9FQS0_CROPI
MDPPPLDHEFIINEELDIVRAMEVMRKLPPPATSPHLMCVRFNSHLPFETIDRCKVLARVLSRIHGFRSLFYEPHAIGHPLAREFVIKILVDIWIALEEMLSLPTSPTPYQMRVHFSADLPVAIIHAFKAHIRELAKKYGFRCLFFNPRLLPVCPICYRELRYPSAVSECNHTFCFICIQRWITARECHDLDPNCPICFGNMGTLLVAAIPTSEGQEDEM